MKQATQLEILWQEAPEVVEPSTIDRLEIGAARALSRALPAITLFATATLCVLFGFGLVFFAAVIGG